METSPRRCWPGGWEGKGGHHFRSRLHACNIRRMNAEGRAELYRQVLGSLGNLAHVSRQMGVPYRTLSDRLHGRRGVTPEACAQLAAHVRDRATTLAATADQLEAVAPQEEA